jgi:hypothetical protein
VGFAGSCTRSASPIPYVRAAACVDFDAAYQAALAGDEVLVKGGTYGDQSIGWDASKTSTECDGYGTPMVTSGCVTFEPAPGESVTFQPSAGISVNGSDVRILGFDVGQGDAGSILMVNNINTGGCVNVPHHIIFQNNKASAIFIDGPASYIADIGGDYDGGLGGTWADVARIYPCNGDGSLPPADHIRFSGGHYRNVVQTSAGQHLACLHCTNVDHLTVDRSIVENCAQHDLEIEGGSQNLDGDLIENNLFAAPCSGQTSTDQGGLCGQVNAIDVGIGALCGPNTINDLTFRFNTIDGGLGFNCGNGPNSTTGTSVYGNLQTGFIDGYHCGVYQGWGIDFHDNVYGATGGANAVACGTGSVMADGQLVSPGAPAYDFHLISSSVAVDAVSTSVAGGYPATDYAGTTRPQGAGLDVGAYEER